MFGILRRHRNRPVGDALRNGRRHPPYLIDAALEDLHAVVVDNGAPQLRATAGEVQLLPQIIGDALIQQRLQRDAFTGKLLLDVLADRLHVDPLALHRAIDQIAHVQGQNDRRQRESQKHQNQIRLCPVSKHAIPLFDQMHERQQDAEKRRIVRREKKQIPSDFAWIEPLVFPKCNQ